VPANVSFAIALSGLKGVTQALNAVNGYTAASYAWGRVIGEEAQAGIETATETWTNRPIVRVHVEGGTGTSGWGGQHAEIGVYVDSPSYQFVDKGTRAHAIVPRGEGYPLAFNSKFSAKSRPGRLRAYKGFSGPPVRFAMAVWHPGTEARRFSDLAAARGLREGIKRIKDELQAVIDGRARWAAHKYSGPGWGK
jgi:hypothetical protein